MSARTRIALAAVMLTAGLAGRPACRGGAANQRASVVRLRQISRANLDKPAPDLGELPNGAGAWVNQLQRWNGTTRQWYNYSRFTTWSSFNYYGQSVTSWAGQSVTSGGRFQNST